MVLMSLSFVGAGIPRLSSRSESDKELDGDAERERGAARSSSDMITR